MNTAPNARETALWRAGNRPAAIAEYATRARLNPLRARAVLRANLDGIIDPPIVEVAAV